jgi:hypothetical protein
VTSASGGIRQLLAAHRHPRRPPGRGNMAGRKLPTCQILPAQPSRTKSICRRPGKIGTAQMFSLFSLGACYSRERTG